MDARQLTARSLYLDSVAATVFKALAAGGVTAVLLKGPSFAEWLYRDGKPRPYSDIDVLVPPWEKGRAHSVLMNLGFTSPTAALSPRERHPCEEPWVRGKDIVDLHWNLAGIGAPPERAWPLLTASTDQITIAGEQISVLAPAPRALHVTLHAARNGVRDPQSQTDLARALELVDFETWSGAAALATRLEAEGAMAGGLGLHPEGARLAATLGLRADSPIEAVLAAGDAPPVAGGLARVLAARGVGGKLAQLGRGMFPTPAYMRTWEHPVRPGLGGLLHAYASRLARRIRWLPAGAAALWRAGKHAPTRRRLAGPRDVQPPQRQRPPTSE